MGEPGPSSTESNTQPGVSGAGGESTIDMSTMTADELKQFIETGRTGRRNALPDVTEEGALNTSTAGVAEALSTLSCSDAPPSPGPSRSADKPS